MSPDELFKRIFNILMKKNMMSSKIPGIYGYMNVVVKDKGGRVLYKDEGPNTLLITGKEQILALLWDDALKTIPPDPSRELAGTVKSICRFVVGNGGAEPSNLLVPKSLDSSRTTLYNEVWRQDVDLPGGITHPANNSLRFITTVDSSTIPEARFGSLGKYINEAGLVISIPGYYANGEPNPATPDSNEVQLTHKTFKSFPFDPGLTMTATFLWELYIVL